MAMPIAKHVCFREKKMLIFLNNIQICDYYHIYW